MDDRRVGRLLRAVRIRKNLRQRDLAERCGVSQTVISDLELGRLEEVRLATARRIATELDVRLVISAQWRGGESDRLLDRAHASIVEHVITVLRSLTWDVVPEFTFNVYGDRGSVDILAWHAKERILLIVEVKATLNDLQDLLGALSKKRRVVPIAVREALPWRPDHVAVLLVAAGTSANRAVVARHAATFDAAFPARSRDVLAWLRTPAGSIAGLWFTAGDAMATLAAASRTRVRRTSR
jgi:transcriptional regulator with XRE-family HTH domain